MQTTTRYTITIGSDLKVLRYDGEYADMSNPQGAVVGEVFYLQATDARGARKALGGFDSYEAAERFIPLAPPVILWGDDTPEYGSLAYQESDAEADMDVWEREHDGPVWGLRATLTPGGAR